ncbi:unnamed protein product [Ceutorhynchus assimilis]|uniref:Uncharacterized protein n=1 Tax=Ceutorhynchus assimilis TaxID=467358 RepID=A0A9N9MTX2_9CUCU|nr:unnamed protein product [Ceutorhynchus assimilis]
MSKQQTQKVLIPKGTINPNEDTVIEIPTNYRKAPVVVATKSNRSATIAARSSKTTKQIAERDVEDFNYVMYNQQPTLTPCPAVCYSESIDQNQATTQQQFRSAKRKTVQTGISENYSNTISLSDLSAKEKAETKLVQEKLEAFQLARRQFLIEANNITENSKGVQAKPSQS